MSTLAEIWVAVRPDTSGTEPELNRKLSKVDAREGATAAGRKAGHHFGDAMLGIVKASAVGIGVALAGGTVVAGKFLKDAIGSASDLNETISKVGVVFGKSSKDINKWAANAASDMGETKQEALDAAATFGVFGKAANLSGSKLANFSIHLTGLASDMASFSNTTPQDAIEALTAALRGEFDPIEKYGVLLNAATLQQVALDKGIVKATGNQHKINAARVGARVALHNYNEAVKKNGKDSLEAQKASAALGLAQDKLGAATKGVVAQLTPQQRILAVQAALYDQLGKKGSGALGDFERTSAGLANQQRILKANLSNLKVEIGAGLLPVAGRFTAAVNTQLIPALRELWQKNGPAITGFLTRMGDRIIAVTVAVAKIDWAAKFNQAKTAVANLRTELGPALDQFSTKVGPAGDSLRTKLLPALNELKASGGQTLADSLNVGGIAVKFLADHADLLTKALPYLAAGLVAYKAAQLGSNIAAAASPAFRIADFVATRRQTAAITEMTAALAANRVALVGAAGAQVAETTAQNTGFLARARATIGMIAQRAAMLAVRAATIAWTAVQWLLNAALTANPIGIVVVAIGALVAAIIYAYQHNETFRKIVLAVWSAIRTAIKAVADWFTGTIVPSLRQAIEQVKAFFVGFGHVVAAVFHVWAAVVQTEIRIVLAVFNTLRTFITQTLPNGFKAGVAAIGRIWDSLQGLAKKPVRFIVDTVINGAIIGTFNKVSGFFGGPKVSPVSLPRGFGDGPGQTVRRAVSASGGGRGVGDGLGDILGFMRGPANWIKKRISGKLDQVGSNPFAQMLKGMGGKLVGGLIGKAKSLFDTSELAGGGTSISGLQPAISGVLASLRRAFGQVRLISGLRPGARTLSGNVSYHASGRAVDIPPVYAYASFLNAAYGRQLRELITPWNNLNVLNGRPHRYTGAVWNQHNFAGGNAHIHAALDDGGIRVLRPGMNVIPNGTGRLEPIAGPSAMAALSGNTYSVTVNVPVGAHPAEAGRQVVNAIKAFESSNGKRWRDG